MRTLPPIGKSTILCVEGNAAQLSLRKAVLEQNGYLVVTAATSHEALEVLRKHRIALVILDHMLGGVNGADLAKQIKQINSLVPILLYSGTVPEHLGEASCFLSKAEPPEVFLAMVTDLVNRYLGRRS
jgi:CheY-like chemotaxis protein